MGVDLAHLSPCRRSSAARMRLLKKLNASEESVILLYVGRLAPEKNLSLLFDLLKDLVRNSQRDFRLLVVGDGMERELWEEDARRHCPGRAAFLGHIHDQSALADVYANADLFVHPNPSEPFGIAPLEAMASGLPLVAPNSGGVTSYANPGNAWTVAATVGEFAAAVNQAVSDETLRSAKISSALETVREYEWTTVCSSFLDLYEELYRIRERTSYNLPAPAFTSTPATGLRTLLLKNISRTAEATLKLVSRFWSEPISSVSSTRKPGSATNVFTVFDPD